MGFREPDLFFSQESSKLGEDSTAVQARGKSTIEFKAFQSWFGSLTFHESVAWAYGCSKSNLRLIYWQETFEDIQLKLRFKVGEKQIEASQMYEAIESVASQVFGSDEGSNSKDLSKVKVADQNVAKTSYEAINMFSDIFGRG